MSGKTVFRNIMSILSHGVNTIITERTSQTYGGLLEKAVHLSLEIIILVLAKDLQLADYWRPLYQVINIFDLATEKEQHYCIIATQCGCFPSFLFELWIVFQSKLSTKPQMRYVEAVCM